jgi:nicotinamidase-related amidase
MTTAAIPMLSNAAPFLEYLEDWQARLAPMTLEELLADANGPERVAIFCVDVINGFCHEGRLQSDRVKAIIAPIVRLMTRARELGVRSFVLTQDSHPADAVEFNDYPQHCIRGTKEAETVPELAGLPFASLFKVFPKLSIHSAIGTGLDGWLADHPEATHRVVVGDCTDLCTYQLAMYLKLTANAQNALLPVIVPADCVDTYDLPLDIAGDLGIPAHPGDFFHQVFLYHMALNGVRVVSALT